jgi:lipopolysaccharide heptosyltransferase II
MKIAVMNFGGIGDQILFLPLIELLKKKYPDGKITWITEPRSSGVGRFIPIVEKVRTCDIKGKGSRLSKFVRLFALLKEEKYDIVVSSGSSYYVSLLLFLSGIPVRVGFATSSLAEKLLTNPVPLNKNQYAGFMLGELARGLDIRDSIPIPKITVPEEALRWSENWLKEKGLSSNKYILIHPGASRLSVEKRILKAWPSENWVELVERLCSDSEDLESLPVVLAGGPDDEETIGTISAKLSSGGVSSDKLISAYGETSNLEQLAALIHHARLFICIDSGPMHLAVGLGTRTVAIFGPTSEKKLLPEDPRFTPVRRKLDCSPCLFDKRNQACEDPKCLQVSVDQVEEAIRKAFK